MAVVMNVSPHAQALTVGTLGPKETRNVDTTLPIEAVLLAQGFLVVVDGAVSPPAPVTPPGEWRSPVATADDLPASGNRDGDVRIARDSSVAYVWSEQSAAWVALAGGGGSTDPEIVRDTIAASLVAGANVAITANDAGNTISVALTGLATVATSGAYTDLTAKPSLAPVATSGAYTDLSAKPSLAPVATSGSYTDLTGKPAITSAATLTAAVDPGASAPTWIQTRAGQPVAIRQTVNSFAVSKTVPTVPAVHAGEAGQHLRCVNGHDDYPDSWSWFLPGWDGVSTSRPLSNTWMPYLLTGPGTTKLNLASGAPSLATQGARALFTTFRSRAKEFGDPNDYGTARGNYKARQYGIKLCGIVGDPTQEVQTLANLYNSYLQPMTLAATGVSYPAAAPSDIFAGLEQANEPGYNNAALSLQLANMAAYMVGSAWADVPLVLASLLDMGAVGAWGDQRARAGRRGRLVHANPHPYPGGGAPDEGHYDYSRSLYARDQGLRNAPGQPVWVTETGYHTEAYTNDPHPGVSEIAQAAYTLRMYLVNIRDLPRGSKTFNYQLIEGWPTHDPGFFHPGEQGFGYVDTSSATWRVKPAYWAHRAAILLMEDTGATGPLPDADAPVQIIAGRLTTTDVLPVYWSDGRFGAWVWDSRVIYDRDATAPRDSTANITVAPYDLTFTVPPGVTSVKLADPITSETTLTTLTPSGGTVTVSCSANNPRLVIFQ